MASSLRFTHRYGRLPLRDTATGRRMFYNPYHGEDGKFTTAGGGGGASEHTGGGIHNPHGLGAEHSTHGYGGQGSTSGATNSFQIGRIKVRVSDGTSAPTLPGAVRKAVERADKELNLPDGVTVRLMRNERASKPGRGTTLPQERNIFVWGKGLSHGEIAHVVAHELGHMEHYHTAGEAGWMAASHFEREHYAETVANRLAPSTGISAALDR